MSSTLIAFASVERKILRVWAVFIIITLGPRCMIRQTALPAFWSNVLHVYVRGVFYPEDGGSVFLRNLIR